MPPAFYMITAYINRPLYFIRDRCLPKLMRYGLSTRSSHASPFIAVRFGREPPAPIRSIIRSSSAMPGGKCRYAIANASFSSAPPAAEAAAAGGAAEEYWLYRHYLKRRALQSELERH